MSTTPALVVVDDEGPPIPEPHAVRPAPWHTDPILRACAALQAASLVATTRLSASRADDRGQSTAEYALVILGAAAVAALLVAWASQTNKISRLLDVILDSIINRFR
jgi:hypothetical protein